VVGNIKTSGLPTGTDGLPMYFTYNETGLHGRGYVSIGIGNSDTDNLPNITFGIGYYDEDNALRYETYPNLAPGQNNTISPGYLPGTWKLVINIYRN
jgi:hypothetical protein